MIKGYGEKIEKFYQDLRQENLKEHQKRRELIKQKCPEIINIENNIAFLSINLFKNLNTEDLDISINKIKSKIHDLRIKKSELLVSLNFPQNYLDLIYNCKKCKDTGYISTSKCNCFYKTLSMIYLKDSDLKHLIEKNNFDNFDFNLYSTDKIHGEILTPRDNIEKIYKGILDYLKDFEQINKNILLLGGCGTGKTFLTHCISKELLNKGFLVIYKTSEDLYKELQNFNSFKNTQSIDDSLIMLCDLLIIDDLGAEPHNKNYTSQFFNFINKKLTLNKKLLISTNIPFKEIQEIYSERIFSRIFGNFTFYKLYVDQDIRIKMKINQKN